MGKCNCGNQPSVIKPDEETRITETRVVSHPVVSNDILQYALLGGIVIIILLIINKKC